MKMSGWGDLECGLYKASQAAITDGGLFTDTSVNERGENEWQSENDNEMKVLHQYADGFVYCTRIYIDEYSSVIDNYIFNLLNYK